MTLKFISCNFAQKAFEGKFNSSPLHFNNLPVHSPSNICKIMYLDNPVAVQKQGNDSVGLYQEPQIPWENYFMVEHKSAFCKL